VYDQLKTTLSRRGFCTAVAGATLGTGLLLPRAARADTLEDIRKSGTITIGNSGAFPNFESVQNGNLVGYDIDLGNEIAKRMGLKPNWQVIDFAGIIAALTSGRVDILVTAMVETPERAARIAFSKPYYDSGIAVAYRPNEQIEKPSDLDGKIIAVQVGTAGEQYARKVIGDKAKGINSYNDFLSAFEDVEAGRADAVINTMPAIKYNDLKRGDKLKIAGPWDHRVVGINTRLGDTALMAAIDQQLTSLRASGFLKELDKKWFES
jgi:ABC-type amino acid transport substrate-binding protein